MERNSPLSDLKQNLSRDEHFLRAIAEVEQIVGSNEPLVTAPDETDAQPKRRRSLARPLGVSLFVVSGVAVALALVPTSQPDRGHAPAWQSAARQ